MAKADRITHHPHCMGCGTENPAALDLELYRDGDGLAGRCRFEERHEGPPGLVHGGAVAAALDEALSMLVVLRRRPGVTASLTIDFRAPVRPGEELELRARPGEAAGRKLRCSGELRRDGTVVAEARALLVEVDGSQFDQSRVPPWVRPA